MPRGCPAYSRAGTPQPSTCVTSVCETKVDEACTSDSTCEGKPVTDDSADKCSKNECVCVKSNCYRRCKNNLECAHDFACDTGRQVCVETAGCDNDAFCQTSLNTVAAKCVNKECKRTCGSDIECNGSGLSKWTSTPFNGQVCEKGLCEIVGCGSDSECTSDNDGGTNVRMFCQTPPARSAVEKLSSAITN